MPQYVRRAFTTEYSQTIYSKMFPESIVIITPIGVLEEKVALIGQFISKGGLPDPSDEWKELVLDINISETVNRFRGCCDLIIGVVSLVDMYFSVCKSFRIIFTHNYIFVYRIAGHFLLTDSIILFLISSRRR